MSEPQQRSYTAVAINGTGDPRIAETTRLVWALFALGVEALADCPFMETVEEVGGELKREHTWLLQPQSRDGKYQTEELRKAWSDRAWLDSHPHHPLTCIRAAFIQQAHGLAELEKSVPLMVVRRGEKRALIPQDATPEEEAFLLSKIA